MKIQEFFMVSPTSRIARSCEGIVGAAVVFLLLFAPVSTIQADSLEGKVLRVLSGDALILKEKSKKTHVIRLSGINAPVKGQPFFEKSRSSLYRLTRKRKIQVEWDKFDDRCSKDREPTSLCEKIGRVIVDRTDVNLEQVKRGLAWHNVLRMEEQSTPDRTLYSEAENEARKKRRGLWKAKSPVPPWKFRTPAGK